MPTETLTATIEKLVEGGRGLARLGSEVLLVRGGIPGETVTVTGGVHHKGYREGMIREVLAASADRVAPPCPVYGICGGCQLQHMRYEVQLAQKQAILRETLRRVGKVQVEEVPRPLASPDPLGYRSVVRFVVFREQGTFRLGFHQEGTHSPVAASSCLLAHPGIREVVASISKTLAAQKTLPLRVESMEIRRSGAFGSTLLINRTGPGDRDRARGLFALFQDIPGVVGQVATVAEGRRGQRWASGQGWIDEHLDDLTFRISDRSFMQANWSLYEVVVRVITDWVRPEPGMRMLELFAGIGTLGLPLARRGVLVTEVEANPHAIADARHAAKRNHIGRCRFRRLQAEAVLERTGEGEYDLVMVDPPRTGLSQACLQGLLRLGVPRVLYLSCDTATLARDLGRLCAGGYRLSRMQPFDMFPQTAHLETLVELVRGDRVRG